jgi:hypothetical protein
MRSKILGPAWGREFGRKGARVECAGAAGVRESDTGAGVACTRMLSGLQIPRAMFRDEPMRCWSTVVILLVENLSVEALNEIMLNQKKGQHDFDETKRDLQSILARQPQDLRGHRRDSRAGGCLIVSFTHARTSSHT